jgi:hypothetical protein
LPSDISAAYLPLGRVVRGRTETSEPPFVDGNSERQRAGVVPNDIDGIIGRVTSRREPMKIHERDTSAANLSKAYVFVVIDVTLGTAIAVMQ